MTSSSCTNWKRGSKPKMRGHERQLERLGEGRDDVGAEHVREAQQRDGHVRVVLGEVADVALDLEQRPLDRGAGAARCGGVSSREPHRVVVGRRRRRASTTSRRRCAPWTRAADAAANRFIVPMTLISCIVRDAHRVESTTRKVCTIVSTWVACTMRDRIE